MSRMKWLVVVMIDGKSGPRLDAMPFHLSDIIDLYRSENVALCMPSFGSCKEEAINCAKLMLDDVLNHSSNQGEKSLYRRISAVKTDLFDNIARAELVRVLEANDRNKSKTAAMLGINRKTLYRQLKKVGLR